MKPKKLHDLTDRRFYTLTPECVHAYVTSRGWKPYSEPKYQLWAHDDFRNDDGELIPEIVPPQKSDAFLTRVAELLRALSDFENRPAFDIMEDMLALQNAPASNGRNGTHKPRRTRKPAK